MTALAFWRLGIGSGSGYVELKEVAFLDASMVDVSVGGVASASSEYSATYSAAKAFDKSTSTSWSTVSGGIPAWIQYQHPTPVDIAAVKITANGIYGPGGFTLRGSANGTDWSAQVSLALAAGGPVSSSVESILVPAAAFSGLVDAVASRLRLGYGSPKPEFHTDGIPRARFLYDLENGGRGVILGTVKLDTDPVDLPLRRRVRLHREVDGMPVRETWSDAATGAYLFTHIHQGMRYTVIAYDHEHNYRAVVADNVTPEVLP